MMFKLFLLSNASKIKNLAYTQKIIVYQIGKILFEISEKVWQKAKAIQRLLLDAPDENSQNKILAEYNAQGSVLGKLDATYLPRYHEMKTSQGFQSIGIPGLTHNFIGIHGELYAIANEHDSPMLGRGTYGQVFLGQNSQGKTCAIKQEMANKHHPNEVDVLGRLGYLQGTAHIKQHVYTIMDVFPGTSLAKIYEKGKISDPWQAAAKELGYSVENLAEVKEQLMGYDDFDDIFFYDLICKTMSKNNHVFDRDALEQLKEKAADIQCRNTYSRHECTQFALATAQEMKRIFNMGLLHRDIKGDNFVGELDCDGNVRVAMIDFGGAIDIKHAAEYKRASGTPDYMAPEVIKALPLDFLRKINRHASLLEGPAQFSTASDIFSFAIMCKKDFNLDDQAGFGVLELAQAPEPEDRPNIDEILCFLKADLALLSHNRNEQKQALNEIYLLQPSLATTQTLKNEISQQLIKATMYHIRHDASKTDLETQYNADKENYQP